RDVLNARLARRTERGKRGQSNSCLESGCQSDPSILEDQEHPDCVPCTEPSYDKSAKLSQLERYRRRTLRRAILQVCLPHSADKTKLDLSSHSRRGEYVRNSAHNEQKTLSNLC
ncbi:unnamed protein product, partial [Timema podura]|nr:unnamed protein product [Timema podura]